MSFCLCNKKNITRRLEDNEFYFLVAKTIFYSLAVLVRKILFCHSKIKFISSRHRVISSIQDIRYTGSIMLKLKQWALQLSCRLCIACVVISNMWY